MAVKKNIVTFAVGGAAYVGLELLWRGRSHSSMFFAGGSCFLLLGALQRSRLPLPLQAVLGALGITGVELATGLVVNRSYAVWDYRDMPLNFLGQICLPYCLLWVPVSTAGLLLHQIISKPVGEGH